MTFYFKGKIEIFEGSQSFLNGPAYSGSEQYELVDEYQLPEGLDPVGMMHDEFSRIHTYEDVVGKIETLDTGSRIRIYRHINANTFLVPIIKTARQTHIVMTKRMYPEDGGLSFIGLFDATDIRDADPIATFEERKGLKLSHGEVRKVSLSHDRSIHFVTLNYPDSSPNLALQHIAKVKQQFQLIPLRELGEDHRLGILSRFIKETVQEELKEVQVIQPATDHTLAYTVAAVAAAVLLKVLLF